MLGYKHFGECKATSHSCLIVCGVVAPVFGRNLWHFLARNCTIRRLAASRNVYCIIRNEFLGPLIKVKNEKEKKTGQQQCGSSSPNLSQQLLHTFALENIFRCTFPSALAWLVSCLVLSFHFAVGLSNYANICAPRKAKMPANCWAVIDDAALFAFVIAAS